MVKMSEQVAQDILELTGYDTTALINMGIVQPYDARKWVVKQKYFLLAKTGRTLTDIKYDLSEIYGMSVSSIEKLIYRDCSVI